MKSLLLLRHAKSSWDDGTVADVERPLAVRGRQAASAMADELARRGWVPDHVLVSPARRTRETWAAFQARLSAAPEVQFPRALYEAAAPRLLDTLRQMSDDARTVLLIGHNPGLEELAKKLSGPGSDRSALARLRSKFPTAAVARLAVEGSWAELGWRLARLTDFVRPKDL